MCVDERVYRRAVGEIKKESSPYTHLATGQKVQDGWAWAHIIGYSLVLGYSLILLFSWFLEVCERDGLFNL